MILTEEEVALKTKIWYNANKEYLEEMAVRRMVEKDRGKDHRKKGGTRKRKPISSASTPAEAAKQLVAAKKVSKKINQAVFDDMFESPESIEKIKQDSLKRKADDVDLDGYEVVEESGELPQAKVRKTDKDEEQDEDEEEDEEEEMVAPYGGYEQDHYDYEDNYYDYGDDDF